MDNILDVVEEPGPDIRESNLLQTIWFYPAATFKFVLKHLPNKYVNLLFLLGAFVNSLSRTGSATYNRSGSIYLIFQILSATLIGWGIYYILAWATHQTGKWLGAKGQLWQVRNVLAWSLIPAICVLLLIIPQLIFLGFDYFSSEMEIESLTFSAVLIGISIVGAILMIWSVVLFVRGIMLVHEFGAGRAVINVLLPYFLIMCIALIIGALFLTFR